MVKANPALPVSILPSLGGGTAGQVLLSSNGCIGSTNGATAGSNGLSQSAAIPRSSVPSSFCQPLPLQWVGIEIEHGAQGPRLFWTTAREPVGSWFVIQQSPDAVNWQETGQLPGEGDPLRMHHYAFPIAPLGPETYYRVVLHDPWGEGSISPVRFLSQPTFFDVRLANHRLRPDQEISLLINLPNTDEGEVRLLDLQGKVLYHEREHLPQGRTSLSLRKPSLPPGLYLLHLTFREQNRIFKVLVVQ